MAAVITDRLESRPSGELWLKSTSVRVGSIVRLPDASLERQKYLREQTESLQRPRTENVCQEVPAVASFEDVRLCVGPSSAFLTKGMRCACE
jgi:hypothetical protein